MTPQDLENMKRSDLLTLAKQIGVKGFSRLTKSELIQSVMEMMEKGGDVLKKEIQKFQKRLEPTSSHLRNRDSATVKNVSSRPVTDAETGVEISRNLETPEPKTSLQPKAIKSRVQKDVVANEPAETLDNEAAARREIESMRYVDPPLYQRGQLIMPEQLRDIDKDLPDLPIGYGDGVIHLMPRDPKWLFCYWDISEERRAAAGKYHFGRLYLRLHDVTHVVFDGSNSWSIHQFALNEEARWWYIPVPSEGRHFLAELGYRMPDGTWNSLGTSDTVVPPPGTPSPWVHDVFIYLPFDQPLPLLRGEKASWLEDSIGGNIPDRNAVPQPPLWGSPVNPPSMQPLHFGIDAPSSPAVSSFVQLRNENDELMAEFPLTVNAALRVFGATAPHVHLEIDGQPHELAADGTFSVAFPFPDGPQSHRVTARAENGSEKSVQISFHRFTR